MVVSEISTTIGYIAIKFDTNIHVSLRINWVNQPFKQPLKPLLLLLS